MFDIDVMSEYEASLIIDVLWNSALNSNNNMRKYWAHFETMYIKS